MHLNTKPGVYLGIFVERENLWFRFVWFFWQWFWFSWLECSITFTHFRIISYLNLEYCQAQFIINRNLDNYYFLTNKWQRVFYYGIKMRDDKGDRKFLLIWKPDIFAYAKSRKKRNIQKASKDAMNINTIKLN